MSINLTPWKKKEDFQTVPSPSNISSIFFVPFPLSLSLTFLDPGNEPGSKWAISSRSLWILVTNNSCSSHSFLHSIFFYPFFLHSPLPISPALSLPLCSPPPAAQTPPIPLLLQVFLLVQDNLTSKNQWPRGIKVYIRMFLRSIINKTRHYSGTVSARSLVSREARKDAYIQAFI